MVLVDTLIGFASFVIGFLAVAYLLSLIAKGFSSFDINDPRNVFPVNNEWLTEQEILDRYM